MTRDDIKNKNLTMDKDNNFQVDLSEIIEEEKMSKLE